MKTFTKYYPSALFCGEVILATVGYDSREEAMLHTSDVYPDVDWETYDEFGFLLDKSYEACPLHSLGKE